MKRANTNHIYKRSSIRLSYTKDPQTGALDILDEIEERDSRTPKKRRSHKTKNSEQSHYYPFGLKHEVYTPPTQKTFKALGGFEPALVNVTKTEYQYKYNGKEWQDELGLNIYDFEARMYDPTTGRTTTQDPLAEKYYSVSSYSFFGNNPVFFADPTGMSLEPPPDFNGDSWTDDTGSYTKWEGQDNSYVKDGDTSQVYDSNHQEYYGVAEVTGSAQGQSSNSSSSTHTQGGDLVTTTSTTRMENNVMVDIPGVAKVYTATDKTVGNAGTLNLDKSINVSDGSGTIAAQLNLPVWQGSMDIGTNGLGGSSNLSISGNGLGTTVDSSGTTFSSFSNGGNGISNSFNVQVKPGGMIIGAAAVVGVIVAPQITIPVLLGL